MEKRKVLKHPLGEKNQLIIEKHQGSPSSGNFIQVKHRIKLKIKIYENMFLSKSYKRLKFDSDSLKTYLK